MVRSPIMMRGHPVVKARRRPIESSHRPIFQRLSSNVLLQSFIVVLAIALTFVLAAGAWDAWRALGSDRLLARIADASGHGFRALHILRLDRSLSVRALNVEGVIEPGQHKQISQSRETELPALRSLVVALRDIDFAERGRVMAGLTTVESRERY